MNELIQKANDAAITSHEIAQLVESRHDNVRVTIERLSERGVIALPATQEKPTSGRPSIEYVFTGEQGKRDSIVVVAQLSPEFTARLVDRWQELERELIQTRFVIPQTLPEALRLAADLADKNQALEKVVADQSPKVLTHDRIAAADGSLCLRDAAKVLQMRPIDLRHWLIVNRWIYGRPGHSGWLAYQHRIQQGVMCHKVTTVQREDGTDKVIEQTRITSKGLTTISHELTKAPLVA
ncbi:phage antirepressor KilAC domain-containing protein [Xylella fastidiosa]|uniref:phage antirepressor KilAC domain-containing protein n=1 Tax=Xylella fastidiosa TaxID=2371 RepID=UPI000765EAD9|nr:phage antirepressor KilAC domain-containing protein [Xylella fastidiosa]KXB17691.1 DNA-binding protein [Xylella fastidiosa]